MPFSSGTFSLVAGNPVVTGTTISSTVQNNTMSDVATGLSTCVLKDGTQTTTSSVPFAAGLSSNALVDISNAAAGQIKFPATQNASANANTLDDYQEYAAASTACSGAITTAVIWYVTKVGRLVTLHLPQTTGSVGATGAILYGATLPTAFRPAVTYDWVNALIINNGADVNQPGMVDVRSNGEIRIYRDTILTNFTNAATGGLDAAWSGSWYV